MGLWIGLAFCAKLPTVCYVKVPELANTRSFLSQRVTRTAFSEGSRRLIRHYASPGDATRSDLVTRAKDRERLRVYTHRPNRQHPRAPRRRLLRTQRRGALRGPLNARPNRILSPTAHPTSPGKEPRSCLSDPRLVHPRSTTGPPRASASPSPSRAAFPSSTRALEEHSCGRRSVPRATRSPIREGSQSRIGQPASSRASPPASQAPPPRRRHLRERVKDRRTARQATRAQGSPARLPRTRARFVLHRC